jgi:hypothetical protein
MKNILCCYSLLLTMLLCTTAFTEEPNQTDFFYDFVPNELTYEMISGGQISNSLITSFKDLAAKLPTEHGIDWVPEALGKLGDKRAIPLLEEKLKQETAITSNIRISVGLIILGELKHYDAILSGLKTEVPQYQKWIETGSVPLNPISAAAEAAVKISAYNIKLPPEVIDELIRLLTHPDNTVQDYARIALDQTTKNSFFLWKQNEDVFKPGYPLPQIPNSKKEIAKKMLQEAWKVWWKENKENYVKEKAYIINGLTMKASWNTKTKMNIALKNISKRSIKLLVEKDGLPKNEQRNIPQWIPTLSLFMGNKRTYQLEPKSFDLTEFGVSQSNTTRLAHVEWQILNPGESYEYSFDFIEMFRNVAIQIEESRASKITISYCRAFPVKGETWIGEVSSDPIESNSLRF